MVSFGVQEDQLAYYTKKYMLKYIDSLVVCSMGNICFVYYFFVANSHILGISVRDETKDYFNPLIRKFDVNLSSPDDARMTYSVRKIYTSIIGKLF